jgi:hypothetical protein
MSLDVNAMSTVPEPNSSQIAVAKQKFQTQKAAALSAAAGQIPLISKINGVTEHKGAIDELQALMLQALQNQINPAQNKTITIG